MAELARCLGSGSSRSVRLGLTRWLNCLAMAGSNGLITNLYFWDDHKAIRRGKISLKFHQVMNSSHDDPYLRRND